MPTFIPDSNTKRYVIISPMRHDRPTSSDSSHVCPFCPGNERLTPPEVYRISKSMLQPSDTDWSVRVVPNKYPITDIHEVFILSPHHTADIPQLSLEHMQVVMKVFQERTLAHQEKGTVIIFGNHGLESGASISHPHAQLVVIPSSVPFDALEKEAVSNIITETDSFQVYCPDFSQWPYEVWIVPKTAGTSFAQVTEEQRNGLGFLLQKILQSQKKLYENPEFHFHKENKPFAYNYYISHGTNYYIRVVPRFIHRAGFELGTGLSVNTVPPSDAAEQIKNLW